MLPASAASILTWVKAAARDPAYPALPWQPPPFPSQSRRSLQDDAQGLVTGTLFAAFGVFLMQHAGLVPGGTVGISLLLHYATGVEVGLALFLVNLPFYVLAWMRLGKAFTIRTALSVTLLSVLTWWLPRAITVQQIDGAWRPSSAGCCAARACCSCSATAPAWEG